MIRIILAALTIVCALAAPAYADFPTQIIPTPLHGCGTMAVTTTSASLIAANVTLCPNSTALPTLPTMGAPIALKILVQGTSGSAVVLCPFGGICASVGRLLQVGESETKNIMSGSVPPSVVTLAGTATIYLEW